MIQRHVAKSRIFGTTMTILFVLEEIAADLEYQVEAGLMSRDDADDWMEEKTREYTGRPY